MNKNELKQLITNFKNYKKAIILIAVALTGMLLIMLSETGNKEAEKCTDNIHAAVSESELSKEVETFIENIKGAGKTRVMLTFEALEETVYAVDRDEDSASDGRHNIKDKYVIIDGGSKEEGLKLKVVSPKVRGVAVVCEGGDNPLIKGQIISAVSALFDISSNKISVAVMAD